MKAIVLVLALALAGCQTSSPDISKDIFTPETFAKTCNGALLAYSLWEVAAAPKAKPATLVKVRAAAKVLTDVCANPPTGNMAALLAALKAVRDFKAATEVGT